MILIPGVVEITSNFVEHPRWWRAALKRRWRRSATASASIASTDCGFGTFTRRE